MCSREAVEEGERLVGGKGEMERQLRLIGNDTDLVEGGKKEDLEELRKGQRQRCDERFPDLMDWEDASPWLREE